MGKRRTYLVSMKAIQTFYYLYLASIMEQLIAENQIPTITFLLVLAAIFAVIDDIAGFAFLSKTCAGKDCGKVGLIRQLGILIGQMCSYYMYVPLNSTDFCQRYLGLAEGQVIITHTRVFLIFSFISFCGLVSILSTEEKKEDKPVVFLSSYRLVIFFLKKR